MNAVTTSTRMPWGRRSLERLRERGTAATVLVAGISSAFGVLLLTATGYLAAILRQNPYYGGSDTLAVVLGILSSLLIGVAVYVAAVVTSNTFATVVAGRTRLIALRRLIGASAVAERRTVAREGLIVGAAGALAGLVVGLAAAAVLVPVASAVLGLSLSYGVLQPVAVVPAAAVALTTWGAAWAGSRRVLAVSPLEAVGRSVERTFRESARRPVRHALAAALFVLGATLLAVGIFVGFVSPLGVVVAFAGGLLSFTGLVVGSTLVMPVLLRLTARAFGRSTVARLAAQNALRYPERSSRMAIGVVIGVTLVVMFAVAVESTKQLIAASGGGELPAEMATLLDTFAAVMMGLVGVSAVIAGVGLVNLLTLGVVQRRRELGLLRALGLSSAQVRRLILLEATHVTVTSLAAGIVLGVAYGWAGAQATLGSVPAPPMWSTPTFVLPGIPLVALGVVIAATAALTLVAAVVPTRLATRVTPVQALAEV